MDRLPPSRKVSLIGSGMVESRKEIALEGPAVEALKAFFATLHNLPSTQFIQVIVRRNQDYMAWVVSPSMLIKGEMGGSTVELAVQDLMKTCAAAAAQKIQRLQARKAELDDMGGKLPVLTRRDKL